MLSAVYFNIRGYEATSIHVVTATAIIKMHYLHANDTLSIKHIKLQNISEMDVKFKYFASGISSLTRKQYEWGWGWGGVNRMYGGCLPLLKAALRMLCSSKASMNPSFPASFMNPSRLSSLLDLSSGFLSPNLPFYSKDTNETLVSDTTTQI